MESEMLPIDQVFRTVHLLVQIGEQKVILAAVIDEPTETTRNPCTPSPRG
jgi:hypothetical protein